MNIFFLHYNGRIMALFHADAHVVKMPLEIAQMLSNAYHHYGAAHFPAKVYKKTHVHHPMSIFVCQNEHNFRLAAMNGLSILQEYTRRFNKTHKCEAVLRDMLQYPPDFSSTEPPVYSDATVFGVFGDVQVPLCMPVEYHHTNACVAYSRYYVFKLETIPRLARWYRSTDHALSAAVKMSADAMCAS
tara:strand:+ start:2002 stop:2562 length:561 start_codon:yes stop_codon:yes gene_type:complete